MTISQRIIKRFVFNKLLKYLVLGLCTLFVYPPMLSGADAREYQQAFSSGKKAFATYCQSCHTLRYATHPILNTPSEELIHWFGKIPPDLSNMMRARGSPWLRDFLNGFYPDASRPFGSNNKKIKNIAMPNVLATIQSDRVRAQVVDDIALYLNEIADPNQTLRKKTGVKIVGFLVCVMTVIIIKFRQNR